LTRVEALLRLQIPEREPAREALWEREEWSCPIFDEAPQALAMVDRTGRFLRVNAAWEQMFGFKEAEAQHLTIGDITSRRDLTESQEKLDRLFRRELDRYRLEKHFVRKDGTLFWGDLTVTLLEDAESGARSALGVVVDITERKLAEDALWESETRYRLLMEQSPYSIEVFGPNGTMVFANEAWERIWGFDREIAVGRYNALEDPIARDLGLSSYIQAAFRGEVGEIPEAFYVSPDDPSKNRWLHTRFYPLKDKTGQVLNVVVLNEDISERKRSEEALRLRAEELTILNALGRKATASLAVDQVVGAALDGVVAATHPDLALFFLREGDELHLKGYGPPDGRYRHDETPLHRIGECLCGLAARDQMPIYSRDIHQDPRCTWDECKRAGLRSFAALPLHGQEGVIGVLGLASATKRDFGEQASFLETLASQIAVGAQNALLFEQLRASQEQLHDLAGYLETSREEERTRIARGIHDELGQVLTALKIDLSWLARRLPDGQLGLTEKVGAMSDLVDATIQTVRRVATELRPGVLDDLGLAAALEWQAGEFSARTGIGCELDLCDPEMALDHDLSTALFRIVQETLTNVARHAEATQVKVKLSRGPDGLVLVIRDDGRGITVEETLDPKSLGLLGMQERARAWGGDVAFHGVRGEGTTVTVKIPWVEGRENGEETSN
jgi:PAS domain S-box-containing protein